MFNLYEILNFEQKNVIFHLSKWKSSFKYPPKKVAQCKISLIASNIIQKKHNWHETFVKKNILGQAIAYLDLSNQINYLSISLKNNSYVRQIFLISFSNITFNLSCNLAKDSLINKSISSFFSQCLQRNHIFIIFLVTVLVPHE